MRSAAAAHGPAGRRRELRQGGGGIAWQRPEKLWGVEDRVERTRPVPHGFNEATRERACVCVRARARARACVCVRACVGALQRASSMYSPTSPACHDVPHLTPHQPSGADEREGVCVWGGDARGQDRSYPSSLPRRPPARHPRLPPTHQPGPTSLSLEWCRCSPPICFSLPSSSSSHSLPPFLPSSLPPSLSYAHAHIHARTQGHTRSQ